MAQRAMTQAGPTVPFLDFAPMHGPLQAAMLDDIAQLLQSGAFTNGPAVAAFEEAFAAYCGVEHCVGVGSGLDALRLGLVATGIEPGAEVVVPAATFVATLEAVTQAGGVPVVVDVSEDDYCLDPEGVAAVVGSRTHALMPVHLYGQLADMLELRRIADDAGVAIVEDACQAHGATRDGERAGASGVAAAFSFYPGKNLGAAGDAGALVTRDGEVAARVRALREHGQTAKYIHALRRLDVATRHDPGDRALAQAAGARDVERPAPRRGRVLQRRALGRRRPAATAGPRRQLARLASLRRADE